MKITGEREERERVKKTLSRSSTEKILTQISPEAENSRFFQFHSLKRLKNQSETMRKNSLFVRTASLYEALGNDGRSVL